MLTIANNLNQTWTLDIKAALQGEAFAGVHLMASCFNEQTIPVGICNPIFGGTSKRIGTYHEVPTETGTHLVSANGAVSPYTAGDKIDVSYSANRVANAWARSYVWNVTYTLVPGNI